MAISASITRTGIKTAIKTDGAMRFAGKWAILTKIGWAIIVLVIGLSIILGLPYGYQTLTQTCTTNCYIYSQLSPTNAVDLQKFGISLETYALVYSSLFVVFALVCLGTSGLLIWKKPGQFMPFCAAFFILALIKVEGSYVFYGRLFQDYPWLETSINLLGLFWPFCGPYLFLAFPNGKFKSNFLLWLFLSIVGADFCTKIYPIFFEPLNRETSTTNKLLIGLITTLLLCGGGFFFEFRKQPTERKPQKYLVYFLICLVAVAVYLVLFGLVALIAALIYRYFKELNPRERNATRWLIYAFVIWFLTLMSLIVLPLIFPALDAPGSYYFLVAGAFGFFGCGINLTGILVAVLYANAFGFEVIISRTLAFVLLTGCIVGLYTLIVLGARQLLGFGETNLVVSLVATGLIPGLFQPLRTGLQRTVNRFLFGRRNEPYTVLTTLGQRLETTIYQPEAVLPELVNNIATSLKLPSVAIKLTGQEKIISEATLNTNGPNDPAATPVSLALSYQGETVGELLVTPRRGEERLAERDLQLLKDLARQIGVVGYSLKLLEDLRQSNGDLTSANLDLRRARERLVLAREEERRKLRRDLHDDLAPSLAGLALSADALTGLIEQDPVRARLKSQELYAAIRHSVGDIRRLAHELRPPTLDEFGLVAALQERTQQFSAGNMQVKLEAAVNLPPLPAAVEVATYRVAQEALMNVVRHAVARHCVIRLICATENSPTSKSATSLTLEISDDGQGLPANHTGLWSGVGLRSMREQAEELGGTLTIENVISGGVLVRMILPFEGSNSREPASSADSR